MLMIYGRSEGKQHNTSYDTQLQLHLEHTSLRICNFYAEYSVPRVQNVVHLQVLRINVRTTT